MIDLTYLASSGAAALGEWSRQSLCHPATDTIRRSVGLILSPVSVTSEKNLAFEIGDSPFVFKLPAKVSVFGDKLLHSFLLVQGIATSVQNGLH